MTSVGASRSSALGPAGWAEGRLALEGPRLSAIEGGFRKAQDPLPDPRAHLSRAGRRVGAGHTVDGTGEDW